MQKYKTQLIVKKNVLKTSILILVLAFLSCGNNNINKTLRFENIENVDYIRIVPAVKVRGKNKESFVIKDEMKILEILAELTNCSPISSYSDKTVSSSLIIEINYSEYTEQFPLIVNEKKNKGLMILHSRGEYGWFKGYYYCNSLLQLILPYAK